MMSNISIFLLFISLVIDQSRDIKPADNVYKVLINLGENKPDHFLDEYTDAQVDLGRQLIIEGRAILENGKKSRYISKFYQCTSCHNVVREDPDLSVVDQSARLAYAGSKGIPYLQGSTFWGMVNHETWYNDDYVKKYGDLVEGARNSLKGSIELCATVCSQGRSLEEWEMQSILAYLWSLQLKMSDLSLNEADWKIIKEGSDSEALSLIKSKYLLKNPSTFGDAPYSKYDGYEGLKGVQENGKIIFEKGCQHCHHKNGESDVVFDNSKDTFNWLMKNVAENSQKSIYQIIRYGTYSENGHKEYMPHYTKEKMSDNQIEDLRAYLVMMSSGSMK